MLTRSWLCICLQVVLAACTPDDNLSVIFGGDVMLDRGIRAQINVKGVRHFTSDLEDKFRDCDFAIVNLECPATTIHAPLTKKFVFRADPTWLPALREAGITHCILANNHSYDQGRAGLISTNENLLSAGLGVIGYGTSQPAACEPVVLRKNGIEAAVFSSVTLPLESWVYLEDSPGMCQASIEDLKRSVTEYQQEHPETFIIVTLHWGIEYQQLPSTAQRTQARELIAAGADAIIGHHSHVIQRFELIDGKPVFYSLGNLIFDNPSPLTHEGILVRLNITKDNCDVEVIPYETEEGKPVLMKREQKNSLLRKWTDISGVIRY